MRLTKRTLSREIELLPNFGPKVRKMVKKQYGRAERAAAKKECIIKECD